MKSNIIRYLVVLADNGLTPDMKLGQDSPKQICMSKWNGVVVVFLFKNVICEVKMVKYPITVVICAMSLKPNVRLKVWKVQLLSIKAEVIEPNPTQQTYT